MNNTVTTAILFGLVLFLGAILIVLQAPSWVDHIDKAIALATSVLAFALAVFAAVKTGFAVTGLNGATTADLIPSGAAAAASALLLIASRFVGA